MHLDEQARRAAVQVAETIGDAIARPFLPAAPMLDPQDFGMGMNR
jgi:hypothetical protein